ncbi:hypothetical protein ACQ4M3_29240 [Leptolyngbya sp. AN03gr2]|uniref:hypothetical protein n=1 Tax=unclassified Leptolyngbya TaxID=2650499 RepID=UPI003D318D8D
MITSFLRFTATTANKIAKHYQQMEINVHQKMANPYSVLRLSFEDSCPAPSIDQIEQALTRSNFEPKPARHNREFFWDFSQFRLGNKEAILYCSTFGEIARSQGAEPYRPTLVWFADDEILIGAAAFVDYARRNCMVETSNRNSSSTEVNALINRSYSHEEESTSSWLQCRNFLHNTAQDLAQDLTKTSFTKWVGIWAGSLLWAGVLSGIAWLFFVPALNIPMDSMTRQNLDLFRLALVMTGIPTTIVVLTEASLASLSLKLILYRQTGQEQKDN